jgi:hypothetical protein
MSLRDHLLIVSSVVHHFFLCLVDNSYTFVSLSRSPFLTCDHVTCFPSLGLLLLEHMVAYRPVARQ